MRGPGVARKQKQKLCSLFLSNFSSISVALIKAVVKIFLVSELLWYVTTRPHKLVVMNPKLSHQLKFLMNMRMKNLVLIYPVKDIGTVNSCYKIIGTVNLDLKGLVISTKIQLLCSKV